MEVVVKALSKVKKKFERRTVDASEEVTLEELLEAEILNRKEAEARREKGEFFLTRVSCGLFDMGRGDNNKCRYIKHKGVEYHLNEWEHNPEYYISKEVRWDLTKDLCTDGKYYSSPQPLINTAKAKVYKKWLDKTPVKENNFAVIPLTEPKGIAYALRFLYEGS